MYYRVNNVEIATEWNKGAKDTPKRFRQLQILVGQ
jgi:hypothetical protein